ncbi:hypothetical protein ACIRO1_29705 [Streptomyces sp. NPDC102381]|uniref:hypothetical protein n=1 Tax=Streptomyces sp. NPDC102381 TaxID=3366164 RepID=UPI0037F20A10
MNTTQHDATAYAHELTRVREHQDVAVRARRRVFEALAQAGTAQAEADELIAAVEAGSMTTAHSCISESSAPESNPTFEDGWAEGVCSISRDLLRLADVTAVPRGRAHRPDPGTNA